MPCAKIPPQIFEGWTLACQSPPSNQGTKVPLKTEGRTLDKEPVVYWQFIGSVLAVCLQFTGSLFAAYW